VQQHAARPRHAQRGRLGGELGRPACACRAG